MTTSAQTIINKVALELHDINGLKWTRSELLSWLNDGMRQIVVMQPTATNTVAVVKLIAGTRQTLPGNGWLLFNVVRNMGTDGLTPGRVVRVVSRELLNGFNPNWHFDTAASAARNFIYDLADQTHYFVYPPNDGTGYIEINYSNQPSDLFTSVTLNLAPSL